MQHGCKKEFLKASEFLNRAANSRRSLDTASLFEYGITYLDDELVAGHPCSLTIIGADSGVGKSSLVSHIAKYNATKKRRVVCFFLEGDPNLFADREIWNRMANLYFEGNGKLPPIKDMLSKEGRTINNFTFKHYRYNLIKGREVEKLEDLAIRELLEDFETLQVFDKQRDGLTPHNLTGKLNTIIVKDKPNLIIIDHLHYFDMLEGVNENAQVTNILKQIVEISDFHRIPVIVVSHMRKKMNKKYWIPTEEDLHGSSNIFKLASTVILFTPNYREYDPNSTFKPTLIRIAKDRDGGKRATVGLVDFNVTKGVYEAPYRKAKVIFKDDVESLEVLQDNLNSRQGAIK